MPLLLLDGLLLLALLIENMDGLEFDDRAVFCLAYPSSSSILLLLLLPSSPSSDDQGGLATLLDVRGDVIMALSLRPILLRGAMRREEEGARLWLCSSVEYAAEERLSQASASEAAFISDEFCVSFVFMNDVPSFSHF